MRRIISIFYLFIILLNPVFGDSNFANLWVTEGFSNKIIMNKKIEIKNDNISAMKVLQNNGIVETAYGGGFVVSINGTKSQFPKVKKDWFYYVNGIMPNIGALDWKLKNGDVLWWDFHGWNDKLMTTAPIGAFPEPFIQNHLQKKKPVCICSTKNFISTAESLKNKLNSAGVKNIEIKDFSDKLDIDYKNKFYIIIGAWKEIQKNSFISGIYAHRQKIGFCVEFKNDKLIAYNIDDAKTGEFNDASVILSVKLGFGSKGSPIWFLTGTNTDAVKRACHVLTETPEKIKYHSGALVLKGQIVNLPIIKSSKKKKVN